MKTKPNTDRYAVQLGQQAATDGHGGGFNPFVVGTHLWEQWEAGHRAQLAAHTRRLAALARQAGAVAYIARGVPTEEVTVKEGAPNPFVKGTRQWEQQEQKARVTMTQTSIRIAKEGGGKLPPISVTPPVIPPKGTPEPSKGVENAHK